MAETQRQANAWEGFKVEKGGAPWLEAAGPGKLEVDSPETKHPMWLPMNIWLFLVGPQLEAGTKIGKGVSYWSSPGQSLLLLFSLLDCHKR